MSDPALTPEVLEELRKVLDPGAIEWLSLAYGDAEAETVRTHLPALLAAAQRVQELEADLRAHHAELEAIDAALGPLTEATRQAQVRGLVERAKRIVDAGRSPPFESTWDT